MTRLIDWLFPQVGQDGYNEGVEEGRRRGFIEGRAYQRDAYGKAEELQLAWANDEALKHRWLKKKFGDMELAGSKD